MAKFYFQLDDALRNFIREQKLFFTATAPVEGRINLSPKGMDAFRCLDDKTVAYLDLTGNGNETAAHLMENGRMTIMFCSFSEKPLILRLYGQGRAVRRRDEEWRNLHAQFCPMLGERQIIVLDIKSVQTSCGFAVPVFELKKKRSTLTEWAALKGEEGIEKYWEEKNQLSIDKLPTHLFED